jgi:hypothetical protein
MEPIEISKSFDPNKFFVWIDLRSSSTHWFLCTMLFAFALSETLSMGLVYFIMKNLQNSSMSRQTYKLHVQLTLLLAVQVVLLGCVDKTMGCY